MVTKFVDTLPYHFNITIFGCLKFNFDFTNISIFQFLRKVLTINGH